MSENLVEVRDATVAYGGRTVLDVPHLGVSPGEILTLIGPNGSGKTTLLRLLGLLVRPDRGQVHVDSEQVDFGNRRQLLELRRRMAMVMQESLLCRMSVRRNVGLGLRFRGVPRPEIETRVARWLETLSISDLGDRPAQKLSGGEAQRTSLARAMALDPEVLFLDEPFASLDAPTRQSLLEEFQMVLARSGVTTVFATHDRGEALRLGDRVAVLLNGRVAQAGAAEDVFSRPETVEVARFVGVETLIPGRVSESRNGVAQVVAGEIRIQSESELDAGEEVVVAVRPEEVLVGDGDDAENVLAGSVTKVTPGETHNRVEVDCGMRVVALVRRTRLRVMALQTGTRVQVSFSARAAHLIRRAGSCG